MMCRGSPPEVFLGKDVQKIWRKYTSEHPCQSMISIRLLCNFYWNHTFAWVFSCKFAVYTPFPTITSGGLHLDVTGHLSHRVKFYLNGTINVNSQLPSVQIQKERDFTNYTFLVTSYFPRSNHQSYSIMNGVLRNFAKFTGKHLRQSLFFNKVQAWGRNFIKKETLE